MNVEKSFYFKCRKIRFILNVEKSFYFENKGYMKVKKKSNIGTAIIWC